MSVEHSGPQGYEFQYLVTALLAVCDTESKSLVVEPASGEDVTLTVSTPSHSLTYEIQIKSGHCDTSIESLCEWLLHFPARQHSCNLLARLTDDTERAAIFVCAGRCADSTRSFLRALGDRSVPNTQLTLEVAPFLGAINDHIAHLSSTTSLRDARRASLEAQRKQAATGLATCADTLRRVIIWECVTEREATASLCKELAERYYIPALACDDAIRDLLDAVRRARDCRGDVLPETQRILAMRSTRSILGDEPHVMNGEEDALLALLKDKHILLLTGRSQCGKTNMAKHLAQRLQAEGVNAFMGSTATEAWQFLTPRHEEPRLFLLDDPFLGDQTCAQVRTGETLLRLEADLKSHRFLIVTSKKADIPSQWSRIGRHEWKDMSVTDVAYLSRFWSERCAFTEENRYLQHRIDSGLASLPADELPQPGHLCFLSHSAASHDASFQTLCSIARFDIANLASELAVRGPLSRRVHVALCASASTIRAVTAEMLGYLLSPSSEMPGLCDAGVSVDVYGESKAAVYPSLPATAPMRESELQELGDLEQRGHLRATPFGLVFAHPDFLEASREVALTCPSVLLPELTGMLQRGLAAVNESNAMVSVDLLRRIFCRFREDASTQHRLVEIASCGSRSMFPSVRDAVQCLVVEWLPVLGESDRKSALHLLRETTDYAYKRVLWQDDTPWLCSDYSGIDLLFDPPFDHDPATNAFLVALTQPDSVTPLRPRRAWDIIHYLARHVDAPARASVLVELMRQPHAFVRAKAVKLLMEVAAGSDTSLLDVVCTEGNPRVVHVAMRSVFGLWPKVSRENRLRMTQWLGRSLENIPVAIACSGLITGFGDSHSGHSEGWSGFSSAERNDVWKLWATLVPVYLRAIAIYPFEHNAAHMYDAVRTAVKYIESSDVMAVVDAWTDWIEQQLECRVLGEYDLSAMDVLLMAAPVSDDRSRRSCRMLGHSDTGYTAVSIKDMVSEWRNLADAEKGAVLEILQGTREDVRWLRAVALTRERVPEEILRVLTGREDMLQQPVTALLEMLDPNLLSDVLHVACGAPQPIYWYALHSGARSPWNELLNLALQDHNHRDFPWIVREMLYEVSNSSRNRWLDPLVTWEGLCTSGGISTRNLLFECLLHVSVTVTKPQVIGFWSRLYEHATAHEKIRYTTSIVRHLRAICSNVSDITKFFGQEVMSQHLLAEMEPETLLIALFRRLGAVDVDSARRPIMNDIRQLLRDRPPRVLTLFDRLEALLKGSVLSEAADLRAVAKAARNRFFDLSREEEDRFVDNEQVENWVTTCRCTQRKPERQP